MKYTNAWYCDGSLRDICVLDVDVSHWQKVVDWLRLGPYPVQYYENDKVRRLPLRAKAILRKKYKVNVHMKIDVSGVLVCCNFFWHKEIEFDIDPREVNTEEREDAVADFIRALGRVVGKEVLLTPENWHIKPFLRYVPESDEIVHDPSSSIEPLESTQVLSRKEGFRLMAKVYGLDEDDEEVVIQAMIRAADKPAYPDD